MDYRSFSSVLRQHNLHLFRLRDLQNLWPANDTKAIKNNLTRWVANGYCTRLKRDVYEFVEPGSGITLPDLYVANRLYEPSYVSLETALSLYSLIPDIAAGVTSVTTRPTRRFNTKYGSFVFRTCRPWAFTGYRLLRYEGFPVLIAEREKAFIDFLYYRIRSGRALDFEEERLNKTILNTLHWGKVRRMAALYPPKLQAAVRACREYATC